MEYVHLVGAESVSSAGVQMRQAADEFKQAASNIAYALQQHQSFLDNWLTRLDEILSSHNVEGVPKKGVDNAGHS